jgi:hypothetical protein
MYLCVPLSCIHYGYATDMPRQFIESAQLCRAGNCRVFRNPDGSEKFKGTSQFFRRSDSIERNVGGLVLNEGEPIRVLGKCWLRAVHFEPTLVYAEARHL